jgi:hypothetical protein
MLTGTSPYLPSEAAFGEGGITFGKEGFSPADKEPWLLATAEQIIRKTIPSTARILRKERTPGPYTQLFIFTSIGFELTFTRHIIIIAPHSSTRSSILSAETKKQNRKLNRP